MSSHDSGRTLPSAAVTAAGVDHVRLSYHYLDAGDIDGYGSLLDEDAQVRRPDTPSGHGRAEVLRVHAGVAGPPARHHLYKVVADDDSVVVLGCLTGAPDLPAEQAADGVEFVDFFTLSDQGMLLGYRRFYFVAPRDSRCGRPGRTGNG
jgi:ketosteroid isomerase-like protein